MLLIVALTGQAGQLFIVPQARAKVAMLGLVTGAGMILTWTGVAMLDPSFAGFLWRFAPVLTIALGAIVLREKVLIKELLPVALMVGGGCICVIGRWQIVGVGTILTLLACGAAAVQFLIGKLQAGIVPAVVLVFYRAFISAIVVLLWALAGGGLEFNVATSHWLAIMLGAFFGPCAGFILMFQSYHYWHLSRSSMVLSAQPLFILPMAYLFLNKVPVGKELLGGFIILIGAFWLGWVQLNRRTK